MNAPILLPATLATAGALGLIYAVLSIRVIQARLKYRISLGDGGNADMQSRIRSHANLMEYVPLLLVLMALLELSGVSGAVLGYAGAALVIFRVLHPIGIPPRVPNFFRFTGTVGTFLLLLSGSVYALVLALT
ncbi:MAG: MAPEG family protein [Rhodospirillaceae bacterium]|nr:MAPEG family protein [Rhodospirillaceae bacterium]